MLGGAGSPGGDDLLTVTVVRDEHGYGMKVSGDNPVYVQSVKEHGAAWRAGLRAGDRILRVEDVAVHHHTHQQVVHMIRANPTTVLTVQQNTSRHKTPITAPVPVNSEKQRQLDVSKVHTMRLMLDQEQKYIRDLRNELTKVPDVRKQTQLEAAEQRCSVLQHQIDNVMVAQPADAPHAPSTPRLAPRAKVGDKPFPAQNSGFLSGLPRSLSNLTGQSLRNLRQARQNAKTQQENQPPLLRQNSDESERKRRHNNTVPMVPTTCLDNLTPPPLPPRMTERPRMNPLSPNKPANWSPQGHKQHCAGRYHPDKGQPMHQSMPAYRDESSRQLRRSSHSLDGELDGEPDGPQPNSIALQMSYPLVNRAPPPLQTDNRSGVPVLHVRSRSSPDQLDTEMTRSWAPLGSPLQCGPGAPCAEPARDTPPPGTPPPPYHTNTQPCADPQRAIISMEEDDSPASDAATYSGLFSNLRSVRESKARTAVLLNWLLVERRCACASLLLILTDGYRGAGAVPLATLRRWAYEIHSTFLMPGAVLQLNGVDENMANEIEHVLVNEHEKEEVLRNVFRKARHKAKEELALQLGEFQVKRQVGLGSLYGPDDAIMYKCDVDKAQELVVVEQVMSQQLRAGGAEGEGGVAGGVADARGTLYAALIAAALVLHCRPATVAAAAGGARPSFLQRDKLYKQRVKLIMKQHPQPFVVRGHHLQLQALTSVGHCHHCDNVIAGLAPQAYVCADCKLRVHRACAKAVEESCCLDGDHHNNRISKIINSIHSNSQPNAQASGDKKSRKTSGTTHFLNMERSFRRVEDEPPWDATLTPVPAQERRDESDESLYESADGHSDAISASDDALSRLKTPAISKESLKLAVTDEEVETRKKGHRKALSLSNPLEIVKNLGDEWFDASRHDRNFDKKKSRESLWSEEDRDSMHGSSMKLDQIRKDSKKDKSQNGRKISTTEPPKARKSSKRSSVGALSFLRRKKTSTTTTPIEAVAEDVSKVLTVEEILNYTKLFLDFEKRHSSECEKSKPPAESDSDDEPPTPKQIAEHRRRLSRQTSRSKSKVRGKSQSLKVNTLRKSHSGTLKKGKKKTGKAQPGGRSRQASIVEQTPIILKKNSESLKQNSWLFSGSKGESRREGSTDEPTPPDADVDTSDANTREPDTRDNNWRTAAPGGRGVNRAESCRERDAPRRGKHRNASDPNRLTAHNNHDLEPGAPAAPSGSSSSSSLSSRSNESGTVAAEHQAGQSDWSEEDEPLAAQWADTLPPHLLDSLVLSARLRKRQEVIHELIVSEGSHVRWLKVLGGVFLRPLERQPALLPAEELRALFPNLPGVRERHARLYAELRGLRAADHVVHIRPLADAVLNTLGESGYATCLSKFCRGQRMALEALRERRRKNKELHQFLANREQLPLCGRLQLRDLLACVWQRLTKYQLLLEGVVKTVCDGDGDESEEDVARLRRALAVAKDVLHRVDTAIRTAENEHRLRTIQSKLEIRVPSGPDWDELRRLDLTQHQLRMEGDLSIRNDSKKINVLALMLEDSLVLVQREGDKFVLKPISQPSSSQHQQLSPLIKWDKVLFRPNAAVRNAFFLMNINGVQMHELSANTAPEYATWVKYIQESPLAKLTELKASMTPSHQHSRSADDSGINVSRNPSDASEKSTSTAPLEEPELDRDRVSLERSSAERERDEKDREPREEEKPDTEPREEKNSVEREERRSVEKDEVSDREERDKPRRPTVGRISTHGAEPAAQLEPSAALRVHEPVAASAATALRAYTHAERLRRLDEVIRSGLAAKSSIVAEILAVPKHCYAEVADMAVAEALGQVDVSEEMRSMGGPPTGPGRAHSAEEQAPPPDLHHLLLAAQTQANQLTRWISRAMSVSETAAVGARAARGRCDRCRAGAGADPPPSVAGAAIAAGAVPAGVAVTSLDSVPVHADYGVAEPVGRFETESSVDHDASFDMLAELDITPHDDSAEGAMEDDLEWSGGAAGVAGAAALAARLAGPACGLQRTLSALLAAAGARSRDLRPDLAALRDANDALRARLHAHAHHDNQTTDELSLPPEPVGAALQDLPTSGG